MKTLLLNVYKQTNTDVDIKVKRLITVPDTNLLVNGDVVNFFAFSLLKEEYKEFNTNIEELEAFLDLF